MGIAGVGTNSYNYCGVQYPKSSNTKQSNTANIAPSTHTIHGDSKEYGKVLGGIGFPDGANSAVYQSKNYTANNPVFMVVTWDAEGNKTEKEIDASKVDPANASLQEMMALNANRKLNGEDSFEDEVMMSAGRLHGDETASGYDDFFTKNNWISEIEDFMNMQYRLGNMGGYLQYKKVSELLQSVSDAITNIGNTLDKQVDSEYFSQMLVKYGEQIKEKIKNGETEPTYQIGGQSFTEAEWKKLIEKMDKDIEQIKEEQAERLEKQKEEEASANDKESRTVSDAAGITRYYNGKKVNDEEDMLHDRKLYDAETGVTWYLNDERGPYMSAEESEKFDKWCEDNGENKLKKFAEMTGLIRNYKDGTTAYIGDNGIGVKGKDGTEFSMDYTNLSWYALMDALNEMQGNPLDQQTWNQVMQDYETKKTENRDVTEAQVQELLKDNNERSFDVYGPNAPEEVKQAWLEAAKETNINGVGMQSNGMMSHITQLDVQRAIKWSNGEDADVLGTTVESARQAVEKALYDLENPLPENENRSAEVLKSIEKEKEFYKAFLEKLQAIQQTDESESKEERNDTVDFNQKVENTDDNKAKKEEESGTSSNIVVNPDGSKVLVVTMKIGGMESTMTIKISEPTDFASKGEYEQSELQNEETINGNMENAE